MSETKTRESRPCTVAPCPAHRKRPFRTLLDSPFGIDICRLDMYFLLVLGTYPFLLYTWATAAPFTVTPSGSVVTCRKAHSLTHKTQVLWPCVSHLCLSFWNMGPYCVWKTKQGPNMSEESSELPPLLVIFDTKEHCAVSYLVRNVILVEIYRNRAW